MKFEELQALGRKYYRYYAGRVARDLCMKMKRIPDFQIGDDDSAWTGPVRDRQVIHIGLGLFDRYPDGTEICNNEDDFHVTMRHIEGHECGHQKYTTLRAFTMAQENGFRGFVEYAVKEITGQNMRFTKEGDYAKALRMLDNQYGVHISVEMVKQFSHFVANSIEDGRMERLNAKEKPGFGQDTIVSRAKEWMHSPVNPDTDLNDKRQYCFAVLNQILSLATMGLWQKGFDEKLAGTPVETQVLKVLPDIKQGVLSRSCMSGMKHAQNIMTELYPMFLDACKLTQMEQMMAAFIQSIMNALPDMDPNGKNPHSYNASEKQDAEMEGSQMESGDENGEQGDGFNLFSSGGVKVKTKKSDAEANNDSETGSEKATGSKKSDAKSNDENRKAEDGSDKEKKESQDFKGGGASGSKGQYADNNAADDSDMVTAAMEAAAKEVKTQTEITQNSVMMSEAIMSKKVEVRDDSTAIGNAGPMDDVCPNFNEYFRRYTLDTDLPLFIQQECDLTRKKYEEYFKSRKRPRRRNQKSGSFDSHGLSRLVRGETDVFRRPGEDNSFSGCIEIRLDNSGSMCGEKMQFACETLARIEENLKGLVPLKITAFDLSGRVNVEIIKNWNEDLKKNCTWNFLQHGRIGGGTPTTEALLVAQKELLARPEKHKMLILLTDESSSCANSNLHGTIQKIRQSGIQLVGVYFENRITASAQTDFCNLFDNIDAIACNPEEISYHLLPVVRKFTER